MNWPIPTNVSEINSFLGLAGYYRKFIENFSEIASPLTKLTCKNVKFVWNRECQKAFVILKQKLVSAPILNYPQKEGKFILDTDASLNGIGAVLSQIQIENGKEIERVIAYASKTLSKSEQNYCTTYRELLAVNVFVKHFKHFLYGNKFLIRTDHASLIWLRNFKNPEGMLARWISNLETYDYELVHRKGTLHGNADGLSRMPYPYCKRLDSPDCKSHSSSSHVATKTDKNDFISLVSVASIQNDMKDDYRDCQKSNWLDS